MAAPHSPSSQTAAATRRVSVARQSAAGSRTAGEFGSWCFQRRRIRDMITAARGTQFDPQVVDAFVAIPDATFLRIAADLR